MKKWTCSLLAVLALAVCHRDVAQAQPRPQGTSDFRSSGQNNFGADRYRPSGPTGYKPGSGRYMVTHQAKYDFAGRKHVEQLADDLYNQANNICWDLYNNFNQKHPDFNTVYRDMYNIKEDAKRIKQLVQNRSTRRPGSEDQIERELVSLDRKFQAFQADLWDWKPIKRRTSSFNLAESIAECEDTLHHLMDDYGVRFNNPHNISRQPSAPRGGSFDRR